MSGYDTREAQVRRAEYIRAAAREVLGRITALPGPVPPLPVPHDPRPDCVIRSCPICGRPRVSQEPPRGA